MSRFLTVAAVVCASAGVAHAANLNLSYNVAPQGGLYLYTMTLSVDTSSSGWAPGMGWSWITFGDVSSGNTSPLSDFAVTSGFPVGPFTDLSFSSGGHNGPTFLWSSVLQNIVYWTPNTASETLTWQGTSAYNGAAGTLFFSELLTQGGATPDDFKMMKLVPEPTSLLLLGGLIPVIARRRRARR